MNTKRWIAVAIAAGLVILSGVSSFMTWSTSQIRNEQANSTKTTPFSDFLSGETNLEEQIVEPGGNQKIAVLSIDGTITSANSGGGLFSSEGYNHETFMTELDAVYHDRSVKGILLTVNSPGGGVYESAEIKHALDKIQKDRQIPIYVSMQSMAASGGYYVSAGADKIFAAAETTTGSIGVIMSGLNYSKMLEKVGISDTTVKSGALKDMGSAVRPETKEDMAVLQSLVNNSYNRFVDIVSKGRHLSVDETKKLADGRVYDGIQAKENGLIDDIGYTENALDALKKEKNLESATVIQYQPVSSRFASNWLGMITEKIVGNKQSDVKVLTNLLQSIGTEQSPRAMYLYGGGLGE